MTTNLTDHQWKLIDALREGKKLLYEGGEIDWGQDNWIHGIAYFPDDISIAPEAVVTRLYGHLCEGGYWSMTSRGILDCDTHYMELDSTGKQVTPITKLGDV